MLDMSIMLQDKCLRPLDTRRRQDYDHDYAASPSTISPPRLRRRRLSASRLERAADAISRLLHSEPACPRASASIEIIGGSVETLILAAIYKMRLMAAMPPLSAWLDTPNMGLNAGGIGAA